MRQPQEGVVLGAGTVELRNAHNNPKYQEPVPPALPSFMTQATLFWLYFITFLFHI